MTSGNNPFSNPFEEFIEKHLNMDGLPVEAYSEVSEEEASRLESVAQMWMRLGRDDNYWLNVMHPIHRRIHQIVFKLVWEENLSPEDAIKTAISLTFLVYDDFMSANIEDDEEDDDDDLEWV